ncbi:MAG: hypothetical protein KA063_04220 [Firmicutes bacterium]|nr:hypothetical protein [Bacillota bacterium]
MARYYTENLDGRIYGIAAQDETGLYGGAICRVTSEAAEVRISRERLPRMLPIKLPEWPQPREVSTVSEDYLEYQRRVERNPRIRLTPSEIKELPGTAEEVIREVLEDAGPEGVWTLGDESEPSVFYDVPTSAR